MLGAGERHMTWKFDFMGKSKYFFAMSGCILLIGSLALATKELNFGIDFESGTRVTASLVKDASVEDVRSAIGPLDLGDAKVQQVENPELGEHVIQIKTAELGPGGVQRLERILDKEFDVIPEGFSSESVGPTFGTTVARSAGIAIVASLLLIMAYVAFRFEPKFAIPVMIALFHDLLITAGVYSLTGREVTTSTVAAILTILGYSLYDVVIVFDRIRENAPRMPRAAFSQIVNRSMSDVLTRSLATSMCTLMGVASLLLFGGETLKDFAFALLVGIASGTYSSIFIAAPVLTEWKEREPGYRQRRRRIADEFGEVPAYPPIATPGEHEPVPAAPGERAVTRRERRRKAARQGEQVATVEADGRDDTEIADEHELDLEHAADGHEMELDQEPAPVGSAQDADRTAQLKAERAERKKQRAARQQRKARKHGRSR
jgi:SecD/SecF fusion protein